MGTCLITAFRGTSAEMLAGGFPEEDVLLLPNDLQRDWELLEARLAQCRYDVVLSLGQRPNIKDKVHIEDCAKLGEIQYTTEYDCQRLLEQFRCHGIPGKLSYHAGTSFCNRLYWNGLRHMAGTGTQMVFVHVTFVKNMTDAEQFSRRFWAAVYDSCAE